MDFAIDPDWRHFQKPSFFQQTNPTQKYEKEQKSNSRLVKESASATNSAEKFANCNESKLEGH